MERIKILSYRLKFKESGLYRYWFKMRDKELIKFNKINKLYKYEKN